MSSVFAIARQLKAPGVQTVATFNPTRLSPRLRKMVKDSIVSGYHKGGWSSQTKHTRQLVFNLADEMPTTYATQDASYMNFASDRPMPDNTLLQIIGLLECDCALRKMAYEEPTNRYQPNRTDFYAEIDRRHAFNLEALHNVGRDGRSSYVIVRNNKLRDQIAQAFLNDRLDHEIEIAHRIASILDADNEYPIPLSINF